MSPQSLPRIAAFLQNLVVLAALMPAVGLCRAQDVTGTAAPTPALGWSSWDAYGATVNEEQIKANANWMAANLKAYGWKYITIDMEWFVTDPVPEGNAKNSHHQVDANGRFQPAVNRFPSSADGAGFKPLADYVHGLGLSFGIHILQGIPRPALKDNLPVSGSSFHAQEAGNADDTCKWNFDYYDLQHSTAGQAYYDSIAKMYAGWGVDLIKVDCISFGPYKGEEIRMLSHAIAKTGRPILLSLSPGPTPIDKEAEVERYANQWRISDDIWDIWHSPDVYPQGLNDQFANLEKWVSAPRKGRYPDADMLPLGYLGPAPGWGKPRETRLTHDEQRTLLTMWGIFRSPLMMGSDLPHNSEWTTSVLTNREFLAVDQQATDPRVVKSSDQQAIWTSKPDQGAGLYVAIFNRSEASETVRVLYSQLGLSGTAYTVRDLWEHKDLGSSKEIAVTLRPHASVPYRLQP